MTQSKLRNIGPTSAAWLAEVGVHSREDLAQLGAVAVYAMVKRRRKGASLNLLWALEGALTGRGWQEVARTERTRLLLALDDDRRSARRR